MNEIMRVMKIGLLFSVVQNNIIIVNAYYINGSVRGSDVVGRNKVQDYQREFVQLPCD